MRWKFWEKREFDNELELDLLLRQSNGSIDITREKAEAIPAVSASVGFITSIIAAIPVRMYQKTKAGREEITDDYRLSLLNDNSEKLMDSTQMKKALIADYLLDGAGYCYIRRRGNKIKSLHYVDRRNVSVNVNYDPIFKSADILVNGRVYRDFDFLRICRRSLNGVTGIGIVAQHNLLLSAMYNAMTYEDTSMNGIKKGFLKSESRLDEKALSALRGAWSRLVSAKRGDSNMMVLNKGVEFQDAGTTATENQLNDNKKQNASEVYTIFGLNDNLFSQKTKTVDSFQSTIQTGIVPIVSELEKSLNKFLLLESEKGKLYFKFDVDNITKSDMLSRFQAYQIGLKNGWLTYDEIRIKENLPLFGIDFIKLGLDSVLFTPATGKICIPNTGVTMDINNPVQPPAGQAGHEGDEGNEN